MKKTIFIIMCMILLVTISASAYNNKKTLVGWGYNVTWNGLGQGPSGNVELIYNWTTVLGFISDENQVYVCKYYQQYQRWIPMRDAVKNLTKNTVTFYINNMPQKFALCLVNDSAPCLYKPNTTTFESGSTNFSEINTASVASLSSLILKKSNGKIEWGKSPPYDVCGAPLDDAISVSGSHASIDADALDASLDSEANVTLEGVDCADFNLYYAADFYTDVQSIIDNGALVATQNNIGSNCTNSSICTDVACSGSTLIFTAQHFDSFGNGGGSSSVPEFSSYTLILAIILGVLAVLFIRKRY